MRVVVWPCLCWLYLHIFSPSSIIVEPMGSVSSCPKAPYLSTMEWCQKASVLRDEAPGVWSLGSDKLKGLRTPRYKCTFGPFGFIKAVGNEYRPVGEVVEAQALSPSFIDSNSIRHLDNVA